jgi:hypothetical protein
MKAHDTLLKAADIVRGERQEQYGPPERNFARIATMWNAFLAIRRRYGQELDAEDIGIMLALMKICRTQGEVPVPDSLVDACGYLGITNELGTESGTQ